MSKKKLLYIIISYFSVFSFYMEFPFRSGESSNSAIYIFQEFFKKQSFSASLVFLIILSLTILVEEKITRKYISVSMVSVGIATIWLLGKSFSIDNSLKHIASSAPQIMESVIFVIGSAWLLRELFYALLLLTEAELPSCSDSESRITRLLGNHPFLVPFVFFFLCWIPMISLAYPGGSCNDAWNQICQYNGLRTFTSHHPPVHTLLMGATVNLGTRLVDGNFGIFLFNALQFLAFDLVFSYMMKTLISFRTPIWLIGFSGFITVFVPYFMYYSTTLIKDNLYCYAFLLFMVELAWLLRLKEKYFQSLIHVLLWILSSLLVLLFRNNGIYILAPTFLLVGSVFFLSKRCI